MMKFKLKEIKNDKVGDTFYAFECTVGPGWWKGRAVTVGTILYIPKIEFWLGTKTSPLIPFRKP